MHANVLPCRPVPIGARWTRVAIFALHRAAARLHRATQVVERCEPPEEERQYAQMLRSSYGKLD